MWQKEYSFSRVRVTRAHSLATLHFCFHNLHINEPLHVTSFLRRSCNLEKFKAEISVLNTLIFCQVLKKCPKGGCKRLCDSALQRNLWRLWKQKGQNSCYVRAREEDNDKIENYERMQMDQVSETTVLERCRSYTKKSPTFSEKRGRFFKFRGRFYLLKFGLSNSSFSLNYWA